MSESARQLEDLIARGYRHGFVTEIEADTVPPGLDEDVVRLISRKKAEPAFLTEWRLKALRHWLTMNEPHWAHLKVAPMDYQAISYYSAPKTKKDGPKSLDEVDPKLLETYEKLGVPLHERARLAGVAVDAVFDSGSVATTFKDRLAAAGVVFCPFSEAVRTHPQLIEQYLGSVVPYSDNFFATLNSAVFSDGFLRVRAQGRALPDGAVHLLSHQCGEDGAVRAHTDHRGCWFVRELSGRLLSTSARREPTPRGSGGAHRAR